MKAALLAGALVLSGFFIAKVINERDMTREYHAQSIAQRDQAAATRELAMQTRRVADTFDFFREDRERAERAKWQARAARAAIEQFDADMHDAVADPKRRVLPLPGYAEAAR